MERVRRHLYIEWYYPSNPSRQTELVKVFKNNATNPTIDTITILANADEIEHLELVIKRMGTLIPHIEIAQHPENTRKSYRQFFQMINLTTRPSDINIIANSDIYFNSTLIDARPTHDQCFALSRYDILFDGCKVLFNRPDTQDTWIFRGPVKEVEGCDFYLGQCGCDNAIAHRLELAGYEVLNPSLTIETLHLHHVNCRTYSEETRVPTPYKQIWPHCLN